MKFFAPACLFAILFTVAAPAANFTWNGATGQSDWNAKVLISPGMWMNNWQQIGTDPALPGADDSVIFPVSALVTGDGAPFSVFNVSNGETLTYGFGSLGIYGSTINNAGTLTFIGNGIEDNGFAYDDRYGIVNSTTLTGGGQLVLVEERESQIHGAGTLTNSNNIIRGKGLITVANLVNQAVVRAEAGKLSINDVSLNNSVGVLAIAADGTLSLTGSIVTGGLLFSENGGQLQNGVLSNLAITGVVKESFGATELTGTITNSGVLTFIANGVNDTGFSQDDRYLVTSSATLTGAGRLLLVELNESALLGSGFLSNTGGHTIEGTGQIGVNIDNAGGIIKINNGSVLQITSTITGGELNGSAAGVLSGNHTLANLTTTGIIKRGLGFTSLSGTINNVGTLTFLGNGVNDNGFGFDDSFSVPTSATLTGGGEMLMIEQFESHVGGPGTLTNADHTIRGEGTIDVKNLVNQGEIRGNSAANPIRIVSNLTGAGSLENVQIEGTHSPGNGIGIVAAAGSYVAKNTAIHQFEILGLLPGVHDQIVSTGSIALAGQLQLQLQIPFFLPNIGDQFTIISALAGVTGGFSNSANLSTISGGTRIFWSITYNPNTVVLHASTVVSLDGDYNGNGLVDAADYIVWRRAIVSGNPAADGNHDGAIDQLDYGVWRDNFGHTLGSGSNVYPVPEPATAGYLITVAVALLAHINRRR